MQIREFALGLLERPTLEAKLAPAPAGLDDSRPGPALRIPEPARAEGQQFRHGSRVSVPRAEGMHDPAQRARIVHALANHELQALELFAWALVAFPDAPPAFRRGLLRILGDEQRHMRMYLEHLDALGHGFGDFPVSGLFWRTVPYLTSPLHFVCTMGLTFENANLDFGPEHAGHALACGATRLARTLDQVHQDEIRHVGFAWHWFTAWCPDESRRWDVAWSHSAPPHDASRARGREFDAEARRRAGIAPDFLARLEAIRPTAPGGARRAHP